MEELVRLEEAWRLFGIKLIDFNDFFELIVRFLFHVLILYILVRRIYFPGSQRKDYLFTYQIFGIVVFFICILLLNVKLQLGFALGLFAVFTLLRYRTSPIPIREMTYLFIVVGISVINALATKKISYAEVVFTNLAILYTTHIFDKAWFHMHEFSKVVNYEKIDLILPEKKGEMIKDLSNRTGLDIRRVDVGEIDFMRDTAQVVIHYIEPPGTNDKP